jgi:hypothetical protein
VDRYRKGPVFLAGDAAHVHSYTGGQGIATGMQDAFNLAWKLARVGEGAPEALLDTYESERRPQAEAVLHRTDRVTKLFVTSNPAGRLVREWIALPALRSKWLQKRFFGELTQLNVSYRDSPLTLDKVSQWWAPGAARAGDRIPDFLLRTCANGSIGVLDILREGRPVLLIRAAGPNQHNLIEPLLRALLRLGVEPYHVVASDRDLGPARCAADVNGDCARLLGLRSNSLCLIRPDAHIGLRLRPISIAILKEYLGLLCPPARVEAEFSTVSAKGWSRTR